MKCAIFTCPMDGSRKCCHDCEFYHTCAVRCENDPKRCGQLVQPKRLKVRLHNKRDITVFALEEKDKWRNTDTEFPKNVNA